MLAGLCLYVIKSKRKYVPFIFKKSIPISTELSSQLLKRLSVTISEDYGHDLELVDLSISRF